MRKKGKKGQVLWQEICHKLKQECQDLEIVSDRTWQKCKEKFFNLSKKYKRAKDQVRVSGQGSEVIEKCEHFQAFDEFMGSRDSISPKYVVESRSASPIPRPATPANTAALEEDEVDCEEDSAAAPETATHEKRSGKRVASNAPPVQADKRRKKKQKKSADENNEAEDRWLALFEMQNQMMRESQRREELFFNRLQEGEQNCKELIIGAIRELGNLFKKD